MGHDCFSGHPRQSCISLVAILNLRKVFPCDICSNGIADALTDQTRIAALHDVPFAHLTLEADAHAQLFLPANASSYVANPSDNIRIPQKNGRASSFLQQIAWYHPAAGTGQSANLKFVLTLDNPVYLSDKLLPSLLRIAGQTSGKVQQLSGI